MAFASPTLTEHVLRGLIGFGALACALLMTDHHPWLALAVAISAMLAFRGCPICWTTGLIETMAYKWLRKHE